MKLPKSAVEEFQRIYKKEFGLDLSYEETEELACSLMGLRSHIVEHEGELDDD